MCDEKKFISRHKCSKTMQNVYKNFNKRNSGMLHGTNFNIGEGGYQAPESKSLTLVHTNANFAIGYPRNEKKVFTLMRGSMFFKTFCLISC